MRSFLVFATAASVFLPLIAVQEVNAFCHAAPAPWAAAPTDGRAIQTTGAATTRSARPWRQPFLFAATSSKTEEESIASSSDGDAAAAAEEHVISVSAVPPSWEAISNASIALASSKEQETPLVTFYRDTNGWCPFCERIWIALRAKGIPYKESLISLQNKPEWYKDLVPTTLVPAVLFHGDDDKAERRIVWESADIMTALDEAFPDTPPMVLDTAEYKEALELNDALNRAGFAYVYGGRNTSLTEEDLEERRLAFHEQLDKLDAALSASEGPFRLGASFCGLDCIMVPTLERWRFQLPITIGIDIVEDRPALQAWFDAMDAYAPYSGRVAGDQYSWTATTSMFLRYFGGGEDKPEVKKGIQAADAAAELLSTGFTKYDGGDDESVFEFAQEAAAKLISNHDAVVKDCTRQEPLSQKDISRASDETTADALLRYVTSVLLTSPTTATLVESATTASLLDIPDDKIQAGIVAARAVASRLCVPRDMSAGAAKVLRYVLTTVAGRLEEEEA
jgi:glutathione S-transferase